MSRKKRRVFGRRLRQPVEDEAMAWMSSARDTHDDTFADLPIALLKIAERREFPAKGLAPPLRAHSAQGPSTIPLLGGTTFSSLQCHSQTGDADK